MGENAKDIDDLPRNPANYTSLTPLWFLERAATVHPTRTSIIYGNSRHTWLDTYRRCRRLASALANHSIGPGEIVAVIAPNVPAMYEAHFGIPMSGAVINAINIRLNASTIASLLNHSKSAALIVDHEFFPLAQEALKQLTQKPGLIIVIADSTSDSYTGAIEYEAFLNTGDPEYPWQPPDDEWQSIALGYTSGTTSNPKGVVLSHRGAYLMSLSNPLAWPMQEGAVYLWTLPMFHCNGWCFTWTLAAVSGTNVCLRHVRVKELHHAIETHHVSHFCAAPVVLNSIVNEKIPTLTHEVHVMTAGAAPPPSVLSSASEIGFRITHTYGLSETYGPSVVCEWKPEWDALPPATKARVKARQGVRYVGLEGLEVLDTRTGTPVPADGRTIGEIVMRGNVVMKGYLRNPEANKEAFANGWFHSGDLAVKHSDNYIEIKDRAKDIIISGGENISSLEVENVMYGHPKVFEVSVVARADDRWGESPCAFVTLKDDVDCSDEERLSEEIVRFCRDKMPAFCVPKSVIFGVLPKTATGKIQKHVLRDRARAMGPIKSKL